MTSLSAFPLSAKWIAQLQQLQQSLRNDPHNFQAWRWRIRIKVLTYLVLRYGGDPSVEFKACLVPVRLLPVIGDVAAICGTPVRTRWELREILSRIAEINRFKIDRTAAGERRQNV